jgi:hypothetical protein
MAGLQRLSSRLLAFARSGFEFVNKLLTFPNAGSGLQLNGPPKRNAAVSMARMLLMPG